MVAHDQAGNPQERREAGAVERRSRVVVTVGHSRDQRRQVIDKRGVWPPVRLLPGAPDPTRGMVLCLQALNHDFSRCFGASRGGTRLARRCVGIVCLGDGGRIGLAAEPVNDETHYLNAPFDMSRTAAEIELGNLRKADEIHDRVAMLSRRLFVQDAIPDMDGFVREAELLLRGVNSADVVLGIFDHNKYNPVIEIGDADFWGPIPKVSQEERMRLLFSLLDPDYTAFPTDSVKWLSRVLGAMSFDERQQIEIFHCGIAYRRTDDRPIRLFSKSIPIHYSADRHFTFTFNYAQNVNHLLKPGFRDYWIRVRYGQSGSLVQTMHSADLREVEARDLLSQREKEILTQIAAGLETKDIADRLGISSNTVSNHRNNMVQRLGARDTTALMQLAKMASLI
jgi:DNA-binding CsgD family transcriptional regulator